MVRIGFAFWLIFLCLGVLGLGCSPEITGTNSLTEHETIGTYCDQLLPAFCVHAVDICGAEGPVARCVDDNRPICCQGACSRPARLLKDLETCKLAYAERPCSEVLAGLSPEPCRDVVELLSKPSVDGER
ncbi:MAG: hypothetical protein RMJ98_07130 [Myxococcales bacterium]|nr:hypothetical protein [Polyangiaceae bacterium]MDW8249059.1 hypothetical protein [Myxococcales bacterium]